MNRTNAQKTSRIASVLLALSFICTAAVAADAAALSSLQPVGRTKTVLAAQDIKAVIGADSAEVSAFFHILGNGIEDSVAVVMPVHDAESLQELTIYTDNESLDWQFEGSTASGDSRIAFTVPCPAKDSYLGIGVSCTVPLVAGKYETDDLTFNWDLAPSALWESEVESSRLIAYLKYAESDQITAIEPHTDSRDNNRTMWQIGKMEPKQTLSISLMRDDVFFSRQTARELIAEDPGNALALFTLGAAEFAIALNGKSGSWDSAVKTLETAHRLDPKHTGVLWFLAVIWECQDKPGKAAEYIRLLNELEPAYHCRHRLFPETLFSELPGATPEEWLKKRN